MSQLLSGSPYLTKLYGTTPDGTKLKSELRELRASSITYNHSTRKYWMNLKWSTFQ
ncbi:hypothetical protein J6590_100193, partial [Homalodisca vitripennis]